MADGHSTDKDAVEQEPDIRKTREYRRFRQLLRKVIKAPPMPRRKGHKTKETLISGV